MSEWIGFSVVIWVLGVVVIAALALIAEIVHGLLTGPRETLVSIFIVLAVVVVPIVVGLAFVEVAGRLIDDGQ